MNIYTATSDYLSSFQAMFQQYGEVKVLPDNWKEISIDLLIFTGGEDVHPRRYGSSRISSWVSEKRDQREFSIMNDFNRGRMKVKKILGVCRGMQLLNVSLGGSLIFDIEETFNRPHESVHKLEWQTSTVFNEALPMVNSMHHQGLEYIGERMTPKVLAKEPNSRVIEACLWGNQALGFQFHPEFFRLAMEPAKNLVAEKVTSWIEGGSILQPITPPKMPTTSSASIKGKTLTFNSSPSLFATGEWFVGEDNG